MRLATKESGGRPATGSIVWEDPETKTRPIGVRVTTANGKRKLVLFEPRTTADDARALAPIMAERGRSSMGEHEGETVAKYAERWLPRIGRRPAQVLRVEERGSRVGRRSRHVPGPLQPVVSQVIPHRRNWPSS
jgi:hypothetical protein